MKKGTAIYDYLDQLGVFATGSALDLEAAKKMYWKNVRKKWKQERRKQKKGYTVFLSKEEVSQIKKIIGTKRSGITGYIQQATLSTLKNKYVVEKDMIGKVRVALYSFYNRIEEVAGNKERAITTNQLLNEIELLQQKILAILQGKNNNV